MPSVIWPVPPTVMTFVYTCSPAGQRDGTDHLDRGVDRHLPIVPRPPGWRPNTVKNWRVRATTVHSLATAGVGVALDLWGITRVLGRDPGRPADERGRTA